MKSSPYKIVAGDKVVHLWTLTSVIEFLIGLNTSNFKVLNKNGRDVTEYIWVILDETTAFNGAKRC